MHCFCWRYALALTLFCASPLALAVSNDPVLAQAEALLSQDQPAAAFELLMPLEDERAGDPEFDYLYGQAALESGKGGIAAFAFERCLAIDPRNGPCRVQMARTHLALGENKSARMELETVQGTQPPIEVQALVNQYLGALHKREISKKRSFGAHLQIGGGHDSNVTSTTADSQIALPVFGGLPFVLNGVSSKQEDPFLQAEVGASFEAAMLPAWSLLMDAAVSGRNYADVDGFNTQVADASIGTAVRAGPYSMLVKLQAQDYQLDNNAFRSLYGILNQHQFAFSETAAISGYIQASQLDYHLAAVPDALRYTLGAGYSGAWGSSHSPAIYAGLYGGQENSDVDDIGLSQDFYGLRLGGSLGVLRNLRLTTSLSVEQRRFDGVDPIFLVTREDTSADLSLGALYQPARHFSLRPAYTYSNNHSNIVLSDYERHVISVDFRYEL